MRQSSCAALATSVLIALLGSAAGVQAQQPIVIAGSERMVPLLRELAEAYRKTHPDVTIEVNGGGSAVGIKSLEQRKATLAALARPATEEERRRTRLIRRTDLVGIPIAMDAVLFFVRPDNPLDSLTLDQARDIFMHRVTTWEQVQVPIEERISLHFAAEGSGSVGVVQSRVLKGKSFSTVRTKHETALDVVNGVAGDPAGIGFGNWMSIIGVRYLTLKTGVDSPPVAANLETIQNRTYPLAHYLYLYSFGQPRGEAEDFVTFIISPEGQNIVRKSKAGLVPLPIRSGRD